MPRCKECIHYTVCCKESQMVRINKYTYDEYNRADGVENLCRHYMETDVVPRSEVEELQKKLNDYERIVGKMSFTIDGVATLLIGENVEYIDKRVAECFKNMAVKQAKQEVAREIFEEIEKLILNETTKCRTIIKDGVNRCFSDYLEGQIVMLNKIPVWIAELKKKYIGE